MVARWWVRFGVWLRDGDGGDGEEAEWVMLCMKSTHNQCVPDSEKCKKSVKKIKYHFAKSAAKF